jgi:hypothetical protein
MSYIHGRSPAKAQACNDEQTRAQGSCVPHITKMIDTPYGYLRFLLPVVLHYCVVEKCIPDDYLEIGKSNPDPLVEAGALHII